MSTDQAIEQEIQAKGKTAPRVTPADIEANIVGEVYFTAADGYRSSPCYDPNGHAHEPLPTPAPLELLTFCVLVLRNGFTVTGESACASPENFDPEIGRKVARANAVAKVWPLMGYELKSRLVAGAAAKASPTDFRDRVRAEAAELQGRIDKLASFLPSDTFNNLPKEEQSRLTAQLASMQDYSNCLAERIRAFQ